MIVRRSFHRVKPGKWREAIDLLNKTADFYSLTIRVYRSRLGAPFGTLCLEIEYEDLPAFAESNASWEGSAEQAAFNETWNECTEPNGHAELWYL